LVNCVTASPALSSVITDAGLEFHKIVQSHLRCETSRELAPDVHLWARSFG
jgi:hypothetical protein